MTLTNSITFLNPITGIPTTIDFNTINPYFNIKFCFGDPIYCQQFNGSGGYQYNELATDINAYLQSLGDPGNAYIYISSGLSDPNYPCRNAVLVIEHTGVPFEDLEGNNAAGPEVFYCPFDEECI